MITGMNHTGFVVKDLDRAVEFYREVMGFELVRLVERNGGPISQVVGYEDTHLRAAHLSLGGDHMLELVEYRKPASSDRPTQERAVLGAGHLAFDVDDIEETYRDLTSRGCVAMNPPARLAPDRAACYMQDPDGNWIELIESGEPLSKDA